MTVIYCLLAGFTLGLLVGMAIGAGGSDDNEHAYLLGRIVTARKYEASRWERYRVVAVSWRGNLRLRSLTDPSDAFWMDVTKRPERLGEVVE